MPGHRADKKPRCATGRRRQASPATMAEPLTAAEHTQATDGPQGRWRAPGRGHKKAPRRGMSPGGALKKAAASYSPALQRSTIGAAGLNFSVRDGKRWNPGAMATCVFFTPPWPQPAKGNRPTERHTCNRPASSARAAMDCRRERRHAGSHRAISSARLWRRRLCTCALSTS